MAVATQANTRKSITSQAREVIPGTKSIEIVAKCGGTIPLEWPRDPETGKKNVSRYGAYSSTGFGLDPIRVRALELGKDWRQTLNLDDPDDSAFYKIVRDWYDNSNDPRIAKYGIKIIVAGNREALPFPRYNAMKPKAVMSTMESMLGYGDEADKAFLEQCARYELQIPSEEGGPRRSILEAIDILGVTFGEEGAEDDVEVMA